MAGAPALSVAASTVPVMTRSWTRPHEPLGAAPGLLEESDDLGWKEHLLQPPRDGHWNEAGR